MKDEREHLQLFDLIARTWVAPAAVDEIVFNASLSAVAFGCRNGAIGIAATADSSAPDSRIRRAADSAQLSIQPRSGPYPGLRHADHTEGRSSAVGIHDNDSFLFGKTTGRVNSVTAGGISVHLPSKGSGAVIATDAAPDVVASAIADCVHLWSPDREPSFQPAPADVSTLKFSPDQSILACGHEGGVMFWRPRKEGAPKLAEFTGRPLSLVWSNDGRHLACCLGAGGLAVIDAATLHCTMRGNFPAPVTSAGFGKGSTVVVASGAYRVAAWTLGQDAQPIVTGKSGLVLVDRIATCPTRNLVAVGYANGLLSLAEIGRTDEVLLRQDTGFAISALAWSADGRMLAVGGQDGTAALIAFPDSMFKT